ncbi:MAG: glycerophosphodiester phosphodiesterase family protein [Alphaproteobacteria bacterium]
MASFIIGHRGAKAYVAENTLESVIKAAELGALWVEFDVKLSKDNHLIIMHDDDVDRTTNGTGAVADLSLTELKQLNANFITDTPLMAIPTLSELVKILFEYKLGANIELKPNPNQAQATGKAVALWINQNWPKGLKAPIVSSFEFECLAAFNETIEHDIEIALLYDTPLPDDYLQAVAQYKASSIHINKDHVTANLVQELKAHNLPLRSYTVNDKQMALQFNGWGVESIFTDKPDLLV